MVDSFEPYPHTVKPPQPYSKDPRPNSKRLAEGAEKLNKLEIGIHPSPCKYKAKTRLHERLQENTKSCDVIVSTNLFVSSPRNECASA